MTRSADVHINNLANPVLPESLAEQIEAVKPMLAALDFTTEGLCKQAVEETGLSDFGNTDLRERLDVIINGFKTEANLHALGMVGRHQVVLRYLPYWEALEPILAESEKPAPGEPDPRIARCQAPCDTTDSLMPLFKRIHE